jgi:predicted DNA-binding transcriptional regulator YafY
MSTNKNAQLRYHVLDRCFSNFGRKYYFEDLLSIVNAALVEENRKSIGIGERQLRDDIRFMKSDTGYNAPVSIYRETKKPYYRYDDKNFSISGQSLSLTEVAQMKGAIAILNRFQGRPEFEWVGELAPLLSDKFGLSSADSKVMGYDSNIDYSGYHMITPLFNAIVNHQVLQIGYRPFAKEVITMLFHPYYLKQYNNRWFLFGRNEQTDHNHWNIPLDRIENSKTVQMPYVSSDRDWDEFFYDMIGVTRPPGECEQVELVFSKEQAPYIETKPMHPSQRIKKLEDGRLEVRLSVLVNYELEMQLLAFAEKVHVLAPTSLRDKIEERIHEAYKHY